MALTHNQINKLWFKPSYDKFKKHGFVQHVFTLKDAEDFLRTGAYLIKEAEKRSNIIIPWDERRRYEILANPRLENAFVSLGAEYLLKGVFLVKGYAVNEPKPLSIHPTHPITVKGNKSKLCTNEVQDLSYIIDYIAKLIDFTEFNNSQMEAEKKAVAELKGQRLKGITRMTIPFPKARQILDYMRFKRNYSLHRPFTIPELRGITQHIFKLLDYVAYKGTSRTIDQLSKLTDEI
jgi:hypothetical protein